MDSKTIALPARHPRLDAATAHTRARVAVQPLLEPRVSHRDLADPGVFLYAADDAGVCVGDELDGIGERRLLLCRAARGADGHRHARRRQPDSAHAAAPPALLVLMPAGAVRVAVLEFDARHELD